MKKTIMKFGKQAAALAVSAGALVLPLVVSATGIDYTSNLTKLNAGTGNAFGSTGLITMIGAVIGTILVLLGVLLVVLILYAGFIWMTAQGDAAKTKKAKDMIYSAIIGLLIVFAAYAITTFVFQALTSVSSGTVYSNGQ